MAPSVVAVPGENMQFVLCARGITMSINLNGFEALEDRVLLAGNVTASINTLTGAWTITGDGAANGVSIVDTDGDANGLYEIETDATTSNRSHPGITRNPRIGQYQKQAGKVKAV